MLVATVMLAAGVNIRSKRAGLMGITVPKASY